MKIPIDHDLPKRPWSPRARRIAKALGFWLFGVLFMTFIDSMMHLNMGSFLIQVYLFLAVCVGLIYFSFYVTRNQARLTQQVITSYVIAFFITPSIIIGHGAGVLPASILFFDHLLNGEFQNLFFRVIIPIQVVFFLIFFPRYWTPDKKKKDSSDFGDVI